MAIKRFANLVPGVVEPLGRLAGNWVLLFDCVAAAHY
jgi:hypothetical protein